MPAGLIVMSAMHASGQWLSINSTVVVMVEQNWWKLGNLTRLFKATSIKGTRKLGLL